MYGPGKFSSAADEAIFTIAFDSMWNDDHQGESDAPTGYFAKLEINRDDAVAILADSLVQQQEELPTVEELTGFWIVSENSSGFVDVSGMTDKRSMDDAYDELAKAYDDYRMCSQCALCGELLDEWGQGEDLSYCVGRESKHMVIPRDV